MFRKYILLITIIPLLVYLIFANNIILFIANKSGNTNFTVSDCNIPKNIIETDNIVVGFNKNNDFLQNISIAGDLREPVKQASHSTATIVFFNNKYKKCLSSNRAFRAAIINNEHKNFSATSYLSEISSLELPDGVYQFGIVEPNIDNSTIYVSDKAVIKKYNNIISTIKSINKNFNLIKNTNIDERAIQLYNEGSVLRLISIVFLPKIDSANSTIFLQINNDKIYKIPRFESKWAIDNIGKEYAYSHVYTDLPKDLFGNSGSFRYILENNNNYYVSGKEYLYKLNGDKYTISTYISNKNDYISEVDSENHINNVSLDTSKIIENKNINEGYIGIDSIESDPNSYILRGVAYIPEEDSSSYQLFVIIKKDNKEYIYKAPYFYSNWAENNLGKKYAYAHIYFTIPQHELGSNGKFKIILSNNNSLQSSNKWYKYGYEKSAYRVYNE